jgi:hypothetical protein
MSQKDPESMKPPMNADGRRWLNTVSDKRRAVAGKMSIGVFAAHRLPLTPHLILIGVHRRVSAVDIS